MTAFSNDPKAWQRLDWQLLQNSPIALYHNTEVLAQDMKWFETSGYAVLPLPVGIWSSLGEFLDALAQLLHFPAYFGRNLNALNDCLSDIEVPQESGLVVVLPEFQRFASSHPSGAQAVLEIFADVFRRFLLTGQRFLVLVHSSDPGISFEPVGATPVLWNPSEWLNSKRGL